MKSLLAVLPYCSSDHPHALRLLKWIQELDSKVHHSLLLVADDSVTMETKKEIDALGKAIFDHCETIPLKCPAPINGNYHVPAAFMFLKAMGHIDACYKANFLWLEPDAVPLCAGWLDSLSESYASCPKRFLGSIHTPKQDGLPKTVMFATAVYPNCAYEELKQFCDGKQQAFDMAFSNHVVPRAANTHLIQHIFGAPNDPPRFKDLKMPDDGPNVGTLDNIRKDAVLFHRNKDGSLIELLRKQRGTPSIAEKNPHFVESPSEPLLPNYETKPEVVLPKRGPGRPPKVYDDSPIT